MIRAGDTVCPFILKVIEMNPSQSPITILGCGSYGTALAISFSRNGSPTYLWGHNPEHINQMQQERQNRRFLPDIEFPESLHLELDLKTALEQSKDILIATAVLSGPTFAKELAQGLPTAITLASRNEKFALEFQARIHCSQHFRVYVNQDMIGVQLGGAIKNVIAIGAGISDGMGFGANARTALITRGIAEITRLGVAMGANTQTFMGMSGLGDLVLTCTDNQSRNRRFGLMLGKGTDSQQAMDEIGQVVEGFYNTKETYLLAQRQDVEMPITEQIYQMLFCGKSAQEVALSLLGRERKGE